VTSAGVFKEVLRILSNQTSAAVRYAYRASLIGAAHQFELTDAGLSWRVSGKSDVWPYAGISSIRLSYRPVSMQAHRFRADIENSGGARLVMLSTTWQTAALMAPQDNDYRAFIAQLHAKMSDSASKAILIGGLSPRIYGAALLLLTLVSLAMTGLLIRAIAIGEWAGVLFLLGFAALFAWQIGGFIRRNRPSAYTFDHLPEALLP
jgi:hypothetical protein